MRIQRNVGLLSALRSLCSESSVPLTDSPIGVAATCAPWQGSIGVHKCDCFLSTRSGNSWQLMLKILLFGSTAISFGLSGNAALAEDASTFNLTSKNEQGDDYATGLRRIEDGSVISNSHTIKWRIFTDTGRDLFLKGKLDEAEKYFQSALQEAKEGFGPRDSHVGSSCNNLAEIYTARKAFDKAEPLYLEAINILEESFGTNDIRVGATLHNLGQFYFLQRKFEKARKCYERALKIEGRVLGYGHTDYANTMYHLGMVLYLQGKEKDSETLLRESIRILEENGLGETVTCVRRMRSLTQMLLKSERLVEAENLQRKILHILEISKGWSLLETIIAAESLALTLQSLERLEESQELLERCLDARKNILPHDDIQSLGCGQKLELGVFGVPRREHCLERCLQGLIWNPNKMAANMLHLGRLALLKCNQLKQLQPCDARREFDKAKVFADNSIRIAKRKVSTTVESQGDLKGNRKPKENANDRKFALIILLQSLDFIGLLKAAKSEILEPESAELSVFQLEVERAVQECIAIFQESATRSLLLGSADVKKEYLSCLNRLSKLLLEDAKNSSEKAKALEKLMDSAQLIKDELSSGF